MDQPINPFDRLVHSFKRLPGIGEKTAIRLAFFVLKNKSEFARDFGQALLEIHSKLSFCSLCQNMTDVDPCRFCKDAKRNRRILLVVETPQDLMAIERTREYHGLYHVLHGALSPIDGISPEDLRIKELLKRMSDIQEVILATNPTVEGEATCLYIHGLLKPFPLKVTRLPFGVPVGSGIEYLDPLTLQKALMGRQPL